MKTGNRLQELFTKSQCPSAADLLSYCRNRSDEGSRHDIEKHLLQCPLCSDAVEGMSTMSMEGFEETGRKNPFNKGGTAWYVAGGFSLLIVVFLWLNRSDDKIERQEQPVIPVAEQDLNEEITIPVERDSIIDKTISVKRITEKVVAEESETRQEVISYEVSVQEVKKELIPEKISAKSSSKAEAISAFPVIYIYDLKAINYSSFYEEMEGKMELLKGVWAKYENEKSKSVSDIDYDTLTYMQSLEQGMKEFAKGDYNAALSHFKLILGVYPDDLNALFYSGIVYYETKRFDKGIASFHKILSHRKSPFNEEAEWYLAKSYIENGNRKDGIDLLSKIVADNGFYAEKAKLMLNGR